MCLQSYVLASLNVIVYLNYLQACEGTNKPAFGINNVADFKHQSENVACKGPACENEGVTGISVLQLQVQNLKSSSPLMEVSGKEENVQKPCNKTKPLPALEELLLQMRTERFPAQNATSKPDDGNLMHLKAAEHLTSILAANLLENLGSDGGSNTTLQVLLDMLKDIMDSFHSEHEQDVQSLSDIENGFNACNKKAIDAFTSGDVYKKEGLTNHAEDVHQQCRNEQKSRMDTERAACAQALTSWIQYPPPTCPLQQPTQWPTESAQTSLVACMNEMNSWHHVQYPTQNACKNAIVALAITNKTCQTNQKDFEHEFCEMAEAKQSTCNTQDECFDQHITMRTARVNEVEINKDARKDGFTKAKRITCLVQGLMSVNGTNAHQLDVDKCQKLVVDTAAFNVTYFPVPSKADCQEEPSKPCQQAWKDVYYNNTAAPVNDCTACSKVPILEPTPEPTPAKWDCSHSMYPNVKDCWAADVFQQCDKKGQKANGQWAYDQVNGKNTKEAWEIYSDIVANDCKKEPTLEPTPEPTPEQRYEYVGCFEGNQVSRPVPDVENSIEGVQNCRDGCASQGFEYFGFECPHDNGNEVHCECGNGDAAKGGTSLPQQKCQEFNDDSGGHCVGPFIRSGGIGTYILGAGHIGSLYRTQAGN